MSNENTHRTNIILTSIIASVLLLSTFTYPVYATSGFTGDYDPANWTLTNTNTNGSVDITNTPTSIMLVGGDNGGNGAGDTDYTVNVACGGEISFDWAYQSFDVDGPIFDPAGYLVNGVFTQLTDNGGLDVQSGTTSILTADGDTFGYRVHTVDNILGEGAFTNITNLQTPDCIITVEIDIKPNSDPNCFNNDGNGVIPVAIVGSTTFDVNDIDAETIQLEGLDVNVVGKNNKLLSHVEDYNNDGIDDLIVQIEDVDDTFAQGEGTATLTGSLYDGTQIEGTDSICITQ